MAFDVSVVVVSDYAGGEAKSWDDLRKTLSSLSRQDFQGKAEFILVEATAFHDATPADLMEIIPDLRIVWSPATSSYDMKNAGGQAATSDIVAMLDADCIPCESWLRHLVETMRANPDAVAVSGKTTYPGRTLVERILALIGRSFLYRRQTGDTDSISNNNAGYRRDILRRYPLSNAIGPFGAGLQNTAVVCDGHRVMFEPRMLAVHDFEGWAMECDVRRNVGYATVAVRQHEPRIKQAWFVKLGVLSLPLFYAGRVLMSSRQCIRYHRDYGVPVYALPMALGLAFIVHAMELPGMLRALRNRPITETAYR